GNLQFDLAVVSETGGGFSGDSINGNEFSSGSEQDPRWIVFVSRPIRNTPEGSLSFLQFVAPDFLTRLRFERDHAVRSRKIHDAVHDDGRDLLKNLERTFAGKRLAVVGTEFIGPCW